MQLLSDCLGGSYRPLYCWNLASVIPDWTRKTFLLGMYECVRGFFFLFLTPDLKSLRC